MAEEYVVGVKENDNALIRLEHTVELKDVHLDHKTIQLCQVIKDADGQPYIAGGWVRDLAMGRVPHDVDIVVVGPNQAHADLFYTRGKIVGKDFPVWLVDGCEVAYARIERKTGLGYTGFECEFEGVTLEDDLRRRDLTMNAMAMNPFTNEIIDPFGGRKDIQDGILRAVGPHFAEDPLRVLRVARFAAQLSSLNNDGWVYSPELDEGLKVLALKVLDELPYLTQERVFEELMKALRTDHPSVFFAVLDELGALEILFPEIAALQGRVQPKKYHPEGDSYVHTLQVINRARQLGADDEEMFAALVHDLGKAVTPDDNLPHHYDHESLGVPLVHAMCDRLRVPNKYRRIAALMTKYHLKVHRFEEMRPVKKVRLLKALGDELTVKKIGLVCQADIQGRGLDSLGVLYPARQRLLEAFAVMRQVRGHQFAHIKDGRVIAQRMENMRAKALAEAGFNRVSINS